MKVRERGQDCLIISNETRGHSNVVRLLLTTTCTHLVRLYLAFQCISHFYFWMAIQENDCPFVIFRLLIKWRIKAFYLSFFVIVCHGGQRDVFRCGMIIAINATIAGFFLSGGLWLGADIWSDVARPFYYFPFFYFYF